MGFFKVILTPLGWLLRGKRPGEENSIRHHQNLQTNIEFLMTSSSFRNGEYFPKKYAGLGRGENISPAF